MCVCVFTCVCALLNQHLCTCGIDQESFTSGRYIGENHVEIAGSLYMYNIYTRILYIDILGSLLAYIVRVQC